jgi:hypothetical protein
MGTDRVNINVGDGEQIKPDGAYLNDLREARSAQDLADAARTLRERAQGLVFDPSSGQYRAQAPAASATEREFTKSVEIGGREFTFTAPDQTTLQHHIETAKAVAAEFEAGQARDENGRFTSSVDDEAARQQKIYNDSQAELAFRRGEISVKQYIENTNAIPEMLEGYGISIEDLQATAQQRDAEAYAQDWQQATQTFLAGPGNEWPGGEANKINLQNALVSLGLMDADDKVGALVQAYEYMKRHDALIPYAQTSPGVQAAVNKEIENASPEELIRVWREQFSNSDASAANQALIASFRRKG